MIAAGRFRTSSSFTQTGTSVAYSFGVFDSGQAPGGTDGIIRLDAGRYKFRFDSANLDRISDVQGKEYQVMLTFDYGGQNPTASSRTLNLFHQRDSGFQILLERADDGSNEDYASTYAHINFQVWLF